MGWKILVKFPNIKFHENLVSSSQAVSYVQTNEQTVILIGGPQGWKLISLKNKSCACMSAGCMPIQLHCKNYGDPLHTAQFHSKEQ
jgi:hypothetical protein